MTTSRRGVTLTELMVYTAVVGLALVFFAKYLTGFGKTAKKTEHGMLASSELATLMARVEADLYEAAQLEFVSASSVVFRCDAVRLPGYALEGDFDGDGVANIRDTDDDGDADRKFSLPAAQQWAVGYDLEDDDDDNDGAVDVRVGLRYSAADRAVYKDFSVNGGAWTTSKLAANVSSFTLTCYGSRREDLGKNVDRGNDGAAGSGDAGEEDGVISAREIDWTQAPAGHGNRNGRVDTPDELKYITSIAVYAEDDANSDGKPDAMLGTEIMPPLLPLKRRR